MFNRWLVKGSPATSTIAWSPLRMSLGSLGATTEELIEVFGVVGIGFSSEDVGMGEVCSDLVEELDGGVLGTNGEMLMDNLVPDGEGEEGCFVIMVCATVAEVVVVLVVVEEGLGVVVVGLGVVIVVDGMAGVVGMVAVIAGFGTASTVVAFSFEVVRLMVALVVESLCKVAGFVVVEVLEMETLASVVDGCVILDEEPSDWEELVPGDCWGSTNSLVPFLSKWTDSAKTKLELVNGRYSGTSYCKSLTHN